VVEEHEVPTLGLSDADDNVAQNFSQCESDEIVASDESLMDGLLEVQCALCDKIVRAVVSNSTRVRLPKLRDCNRLRSVMADVNAVVNTIQTSTITHTSELLYATAMVVKQELQYNLSTPQNQTFTGDPPWKKRLVLKFQTIRRELSQLLAFQAGKLVNGVTINFLRVKYQLQSTELAQVIEQLIINNMLKH